MSWSIEHKIRLGFFVALASLLAMGGVAFWTAARARAAVRSLTSPLPAAVAETDRAEQQRWLGLRAASAERESRFTTVAVSAGSLLAVALVTFAGLRVRQDLRKRRQAEAERDRLFDLSPDLLCIADFDRFFRDLNPAWETVLGFSRAELEAKPFLEFVHPDDRSRTEAEAAKLAHGQETVLFENRYRSRDGSYRWLAWRARSVVAERLIYATARDVSDQKLSAQRIEQLNADLQHRAAQLEAANTELEAFAYSVSHDLRAPLRHLVGFADLLKRNASARLDPAALQHLEVIANSSAHMSRLIDNLLSFSRMSRADLRRTRIRLQPLVESARAELQSEADGRSIHWQIGTLPEVQADPALLRVVWVNLLSNAIKYTRPRSEACIEIGARHANHEHVLFVRDNGVGFDMRYVDKLFGVFQRLHYAEEFEGTGIGLATVRRIIQRHGGRTWAESMPGQGATFYFSLPNGTNLVPSSTPP